MWNIHDLTAFNNRPPRYTRSWMQKLKNEKREARKERKKKAVGFKSDTKADDYSPSPVRSPSPLHKGEEEKGDGQRAGSDMSSSDDDATGTTIKGASQYLSYQPKNFDKSKNDLKNRNVNEEKYFNSIMRLKPKIQL